MNTPELAAERLILREFTAGDLEDVYQIFSDAEVNRFLPWFALKTRSDALLANTAGRADAAMPSA